MLDNDENLCQMNLAMLMAFIQDHQIWFGSFDSMVISSHFQIFASYEWRNLPLLAIHIIVLGKPIVLCKQKKQCMDGQEE